MPLDTPTELRAEIELHAKAEAAANQRLKEVEARIGKITQKPSLKDRLKSAFNAKNTTLAKLNEERDGLQNDIRARRAERDKYTKQLADLTKAQSQSQGNPDASKSPSVKPPDAPKVQAPQVQQPPQVQQVPQLQRPPQVQRPPQRQQDPLRSGLGSDAYAVSMEPELPTRRQPDPLRSQPDPDAYSDSLSSKPSTNRKPDPLRSGQSSDAYAVSLDSEDPITQKPDTLRSGIDSDAYSDSLAHDPPSPKQRDPYEVEDSSEAIEEEQPEPSVRTRTDSLSGKSSQPPRDPYAVVDGDGEEQEQAQELGPQQEVNAPQFGPREEDVLRDRDVDDNNSVQHAKAQKRDLELDPFKMKSMGQEYIDKEKNAKSYKIKVGEQETEVHEKIWLREKNNESLRKKGEDEISQEQWDQQGRQQKNATTQYLNEEQRAQREVSMDHGVLKNKKGEALQEGSHIFVMDGQGQLYSETVKNMTGTNDVTGRRADTHHSSFLAGEEVAGAGVVRVDDKGVVKEVTNQSGHYKPGEEQSAQTLEHIQSQGIALENVQFTQFSHEKAIGPDLPGQETINLKVNNGMAKEFLQGKESRDEQLHREKYQQETGKEVTPISMEKQFEDRHNVVDEIRAKANQGMSQRDIEGRVSGPYQDTIRDMVVEKQIENVRASLRKTDNRQGLEQRAQERAKDLGLGSVKGEDAQTTSVRNQLKETNNRKGLERVEEFARKPNVGRVK